MLRRQTVVWGQRYSQYTRRYAALQPHDKGGQAMRTPRRASVMIQQPTAIVGKPIRKTIGGVPHLLPPAARLMTGDDGMEASGPGVTVRPTRTGDTLVLVVPHSTGRLDEFVTLCSLRQLYRLVHEQKWNGVMAPHDTHTLAAEQNQAPYARYVQAVTFAKVVGEMEYSGGKESAPCALLNLRPSGETYGGSLWWVLGGHNIAHQRGKVAKKTYRRAVSSLGATLTKEGQEEALLVGAGEVCERPFDPRQKSAGRRVRVLGYGRSSDRIGRVHSTTVVAIHLAKGERLLVHDRTESLGFIPVPLAEWMRFMDGMATIADRRLIRRAITTGLERELARTPEPERLARSALIDQQLQAFFGEPGNDGERREFHLTPAQNTPPIDRLSLPPMQDLLRQWGLLPDLAQESPAG